MDVLPLDSAANLESIEAKVAEACRIGPVDLVVLPELMNTGYVGGRDKIFGERLIQAAEHVPGPFANGLCRLAKALKVHLICGLAECHPQIPGTLYNSAIVIDQNGELLSVYRKLHIPSEEKHYFAAGHDFGVVDTALGRLGVLICADIRFPETTRILSLLGAEILICPQNSPSGSPYPAETVSFLAAARALENRSYVVTVNRVGDEHGLHFSGHSAAADPTGHLIAASDSDQEAVIYADLSQQTFLQNRAFYPYFADRRPNLYGPLLDPV